MTGVLKLFNVFICALLWPGGVIWPLVYAGMGIGADCFGTGPL